MGGYTLFDCGGIDLTVQTTQNIPGIFGRVDGAFKAGKLCLAENCIYGDLGLMTPVPVMVNGDGSGGYVATSSILQIFITSDDNARVVSLIV